MPAEAEHVGLRLIQTATESAAIEARDKLNNGEAFSAVASSDSIHASRSTNGVIEPVPTESLPIKVAEAASTLNLETRSDIIPDPQGFYIIEVISRQAQAVNEDGRERARGTTPP